MEGRRTGENRRKEHSTSQLFSATEKKWALKTQGSANHRDTFSERTFKHHFEMIMKDIYTTFFILTF